MTFNEVLSQTIAMLQQHGRVSYRALKRQFEIDDTYLADLTYELIEIHQVAADQDGKMLIWAGDVASALPPEPLSAAEPAQVPQPQEPPPASEPVAVSEGERRQATILFSDLSGYTTMNERLDPEEVGSLMDRLKVAAVQIVERHGGLVNQFVGDEVLALFGIPIAHEDDPLRATRAALELHALTRQLSPEVEARIGQPLRMHTGIHTGLIVTNVRDDRDGRYGVIGDTVNTGARLKAQADVDEILVSAATQRLVAPFVDTQALQAVSMKGKAAPVMSYRVIGESAIHTRFEAAAQRGFTAYTGRERELNTLHACLEQALGGQGQFVNVTGEAGVGKSRLLYEFRHGLDRERITVVQGWCQSHLSTISYVPFLDALKRGLSLRPEDTPAVLREKAVANIIAIDPSLEQYLPLYLHLLSIPSDDDLPEHLQGEQLRYAVQEALAALLTLNAKRQPMVLILVPSAVNTLPVER